MLVEIFYVYSICPISSFAEKGENYAYHERSLFPRELLVGFGARPLKRENYSIGACCLGAETPGNENESCRTRNQRTVDLLYVP